VRLTNEIQRYFVEETRLGIPVFFITEATSGVLSTYNIPARNIQKWVKKFRDSGENYSCFFNGPFNKNSIVSRGSKIPPVVYENSGVDLDEISRLCMEYPDLAQTLQSLKDLVIEKDIEIRVLREQVEFVKKNLNQRK